MKDFSRVEAREAGASAESRKDGEGKSESLFAGWKLKYRKAVCRERGEGKSENGREEVWGPCGSRELWKSFFLSFSSSLNANLWVLSSECGSTTCNMHSTYTTPESLENSRRSKNIVYIQFFI